MITPNFHLYKKNITVNSVNLDQQPFISVKSRIRAAEEHKKNNYWHQKYLKYKQKYLKLKEQLNI